ncbi:unnamed protein product [Ambrosiozyma monospora]|uniref:Unnamed protein product n=1 Tax=Ambrosiozyma monospora TaxID=43982 RepID=A0ACB5TH64_AMBMO|nr:unnamed protein product [Ambrosiozyma monospora]
MVFPLVCILVISVAVEVKLVALEVEATSFRDQRHASFSAATANSYTGHDNGEFSGVNGNANDNGDEDHNMVLPPDAPEQVRFSSPQLTPHPQSHQNFTYLDFDNFDNLDLSELGVNIDTDVHLHYQQQLQQQQQAQQQQQQQQQQAQQQGIPSAQDGAGYHATTASPTTTDSKVG